MRWLALVFVVLILALQYPMWLGKGGWLNVRELGRSVEKQHEANARLKARNEALDADVRDLKTGFEAIEERARSELGMIRPDEVFFQLQGAPARGVMLPTTAGTAGKAAAGTPEASASKAAAGTPEAGAGKAAAGTPEAGASKAD